MRRALGVLCVLAGLALVSAPALGYLVRVDGAGTTYHWPSTSLPVKMVLNQAGAAEITDGSDLTQLEIAMRIWNRVPDAAISFDDAVRDSITPLAFDGKNVVVWDENGSVIHDPTVAAQSRLMVDAGGQILDADVVFNGRDFTWSTDSSLPAGVHSVLDHAFHAFGHVLGLDVSAVGAAALFPHAVPAGMRVRASSDDEAGLASAYPASSFPTNRGAISGRITRNQQAVFGAHVVALDASGVVQAGTVSDPTGAYWIQGLGPGSYTVFVQPLDGPVGLLDLSPYYQTGQDAFQTSFHGGALSPIPVTVTAGGLQQGCDVDVGLAPPTMNLWFVGTAPKGQSVAAYPGAAVLFQGEVRDFVVWGAGVPQGSVLSFSGGGITTTLTSFRSQGSFTGVVSRLQASAQAAPGPRTVFVTSPTGEQAALAGFLEILPAPPVVSAVSPSSGRGAGGTRVTVLGSNFAVKGGVQMRFGSRDLEALEWLDSRRITGLTPPSTQAGPVDVEVITAGGQARKIGAFVYGASVVSIQAVTPLHGPQIGGTVVTLQGSGFLDLLDDTTVTFDTRKATGIHILDDRTMTCQTPALDRGGAVTVTVTNQNGIGRLPDGFTYDPAPDVEGLDPDAGPLVGGQTVVIHGKNFTISTPTSVAFGGNAATDVLVVHATSLRCKTPPAAATGPVSVSVTTINGTGSKSGGYTYHPPPAVSVVDPARGPPAGGTSITITGSGFTTSARTLVLVGLRAATSIQVRSATELVCRTPLAAQAGPVAVRVTNENGSGEKPGAFTYEAPPTVTAVLPSVGPQVGGTPVTVTGTGFTTTARTTVTFGGTSATAIAVVNGTTLTCQTPAASQAGPVAVRVTNENGSGEKPGAFTYEAPPTVTAVLPSVGPQVGGTPVTVTGTGFTTTARTTVTFGGTSATAIAVVNGTTLTCQTPAASQAGPVAVRVTNENGSGEKPGAFTYEAPPTVTAVLPSVGPQVGGTPVTVTGTGFTATAKTTVTFGGTLATAIAVVNGTTLTCQTPAASQAGPVAVRVTNENGSGEKPGAFTYEAPPTVSAVLPSVGPQAGGTPVTVTGTGFTTTARTTVTFGGTSATAIAVVNGTTLTCQTPAASQAGPVAVRVTNENGSGEKPGAFTYEAPPTVTAVLPSVGPQVGGTPVTVTGTGFTTTARTTVTFGGTSATAIAVVNGTTLTCQTPAASQAGPVAVRVTNENGSGEKPGAFTYEAPPTVTAVLPSVGPQVGGTPVTVTGTGFTTTARTTVTFGGTSATAIAVVNGTTLTCQTPAASQAGPVAVRVTNENGSGEKPGAFAYLAGPAVIVVAPARGPLIGGEVVTIQGTAFSSSQDTSVRFGTIKATEVVVASPTQLSCRVPANLQGGKVDVRVSTSGGEGRLPGGFEYVGGAVTTQGDPTTGQAFPVGFESRVDGGRIYGAAAALTNHQGIAIDTRRLGLDADGLFFLSVDGKTPIFQSFFGFLDSRGMAAGVLHVPDIAQLNGIAIYLAFVTLDPGAPSGVRTVSASTRVVIRNSSP